MNKLLLATIIGALCATMSFVATEALAQTASGAATPTPPTKKTPAPTKTTVKPKAPAPKHRLFKRKPTTIAKTDPIPDNAEEWTCKDKLSFMLQGDMKRDQIVTVHWGNKNYKLPREQTTTGADRFHDAASGMDLVVIPTKAMLFSDKDSSRLADECKTVQMNQGIPAPTQSEQLSSTSK